MGEVAGKPAALRFGGRDGGGRRIAGERTSRFRQNGEAAVEARGGAAEGGAAHGAG